MEASHWAEASGSKFISVAGGKNSKIDPPEVGSAEYDFTVAGGVYKIFGRVIIAGGGDDSFWVRIASAKTNTRNHSSGWVQWNRIDIGDSWHWDAIHSTNDGNTEVEFTLEAGDHTLEIRYLEDSTLLDALIITDDLSVDQTQLPGDLNGRAYGPQPANGDVDVVDGQLSWTPGVGSVACRLYVSTSESFHDAQLHAEGPLSTKMIDLAPGTDYFWRIDSVRADRSVVPGLVWTFRADGRKPPSAPIDIGSRLELFVDDYLIDRWSGKARLELHHPTPQEVVLQMDAPWEGNGCSYHSIIQDGDIYRLYYRGWQHSWQPDGSMVRPHPGLLCYAVSRDGIHWEKPKLGIVEFEGSKQNNIVIDHYMHRTSVDAGHITVFKDPNPECPPEVRYKAIGRALEPKGLLAFGSPDGLRFTPMKQDVVVGEPGTFDSQNVAFWDPVRKEYRCYYRYYRNGLRDVRTCTSKDFLHWSDPVFLRYPDAPPEQLYTNVIQPYYRAPHIFLGFPSRYSMRGWSESMAALPYPEHRRMRLLYKERYGTALSDTLLMVSRDGVFFHRWDEAFLRPGPQRKDSWAYSDHYLAWPVVQTKSAWEGAADELSLYSVEGYWTGTTTQLRRYTMRIDGFASLHAPLSGGEIVTWPLVFDGEELVINFSSSAGGDVRVEIQDVDGKPLPGYSLQDCPPQFGDELARPIPWRSGYTVAPVAGKVVRLRFVLRDADLFAFRFR